MYCFCDKRGHNCIKVFAVMSLVMVLKDTAFRHFSHLEFLRFMIALI